MEAEATAAFWRDRQKLSLRDRQNAARGSVTRVIIQRHDRVIGIVTAEEEDANQRFVARWNRSRRCHCTDQREPVKTADERSPAEQATGAVAQEISTRLFHNIPPLGSYLSIRNSGEPAIRYTAFCALARLLAAGMEPRALYRVTIRSRDIRPCSKRMFSALVKSDGDAANGVTEE